MCRRLCFKQQRVQQSNALGAAARNHRVETGELVVAPYKVEQRRGVQRRQVIARRAEDDELRAARAQIGHLELLAVDCLALKVALRHERHKVGHRRLEREHADQIGTRRPRNARQHVAVVELVVRVARLDHVVGDVDSAASRATIVERRGESLLNK